MRSKNVTISLPDDLSDLSVAEAAWNLARDSNTPANYDIANVHREHIIET
jgi:hypothetical protein